MSDNHHMHHFSLQYTELEEQISDCKTTDKVYIILVVLNMSVLADFLAKKFKNKTVITLMLHYALSLIFIH